MLENKNVTGNSKIGVAISAILMLFEFIVSILAPIPDGKKGVANLTYLTIHNCFNIIIILMMAAYLFIVFKYPKYHFMRVMLFLFSLYIISDLIMPLKLNNEIALYIVNTIISISALLVAFVAGRLKKIQKNLPIMIIVGVLMLVSRIIINICTPRFFIYRLLSQLNIIVVWIALCISYVARYKQYREIHLMEQNEEEI